MAGNAQTLIDNAKSYTGTLLASAGSQLQSAINQVSQIGYTQLSFSGVPLPTPPALPSDLTAPTIADVSLDLPAEPTNTLIFQDIPALDTGNAPVLTAVSPTINLPNKPNSLQDFTTQAPTLNTSLVFPEPPSTLSTAIDAPTLPDRVEPTRPQTTVPTFDAVSPINSAPTAPTDYVAQFSTAYAGAAPSMIAAMDGYVDSMLAKFNPNFKPAMAAIETQLATYLGGGTALKPEVETAIYERSRAKQSAESRRKRDEIFKDVAGRGFTLPTGALVSAVSEARQAAADNNAAAAREIVVTQAEMEQKNLQFAVTTSATLRTTILNSAIAYHQNLVGINGQALTYAKTILDAVIEVYNTAVKAFTVKLDAYKAEAIVYETRLKSALAGLEIYKAEIQALEALVTVDRSKVDVYRARIEAMFALANVYRSQIEAVQGRVSLEKLKLEVFQAQVQAYGATVQAKQSEYQGYAAALAGETAKVEMFNAQIRGYDAQVLGYKSTIDAKTEAIRAAAVTNQARADQFRAVLDGYKTVVQARGEVARTKLENNRQVVVAFQAKAQAQIANSEVKNSYYRTTADIAIKNAGYSIQAIVESAKLAREYAGSLAAIYSQNAAIHGTLAGAAMSGMNTLAAETLTG